MLSYRHAFHAGNFADVLKHSVLTLVLDYMTRKDKAFSYLDSHSGAGMYQLTEQYAQKTGEYKAGIAKLIEATDSPEALSLYINMIKLMNQGDELKLYPGSPAIAKYFTRRQDNSHLFELHPTDVEHLKDFSQDWRKAFVHQSDGYKGVLGLLPPPSRRAVVLVDPPYELKDDYNKAVSSLIKAYKRFATGTYILWYPVVKREQINMMQQSFTDSEVKNILQLELNLQADSDEYGMTGTGLFIINPPWQLAKQADVILRYLQKLLGGSESHYQVNQLIAE